MQNGVYRLKALCPDPHTLIELELYGYHSKGLPGLEVVGLGHYGRTIKEKFIFLSKQFGIKIPLKRYVLCVDLPTSLKKEINNDSQRWLELPLLILFWTLAGILELNNLDDCLSMGKIQVDGTILCPELKEYAGDKECKVIVPSFVDIPANCYHIPLEELFNHLGLEEITYKLIKLRAS